MGILDEIEKAKERSRPNSLSDREWARLSEDEKRAVRDAMFGGDVGPGKMSTILKRSGYTVSKYFLTQLCARAGAIG